MKVDVLQVDQVTFKKFAWWSDWIDVAVYDWAGDSGYLLQMKVSRTNAKKFKSVSITGLFAHNVSVRCIGDLTKMSTERGTENDK